MPWIDGSVLLASKGMTGATGNIYVGLHEFADMEFALHFLKPQDIFLDVGANIGSYTILASKVVGAHTIAFEPDPDTARHLSDNIRTNRIEDKVSIQTVALGREKGEIHFTIGRDTTNRVATDLDTNTRVVPVRRLDDVEGARNATFLKLDTEGFEKEVLGGATDLLNSGNILAIATELDDGGVEQIMLDCGFRRYFYAPSSRTLSERPAATEAQSNAIYIRNKAAVEERLASAPVRKWRGLPI
ncbi:FkbM family methyltransferase [Histidinibacterium lentulum]|nr:FkbM family methyltransferase [Histidinibacterium lentulum]